MISTIPTTPLVKRSTETTVEWTHRLTALRDEAAEHHGRSLRALITARLDFAATSARAVTATHADHHTAHAHVLTAERDVAVAAAELAALEGMLAWLKAFNYRDASDIDWP